MVNKLTTEMSNMDSTVTGIQTAQVTQDSNITMVINELKQVCGDVKLLTGIVDRQAVMIEHLQRQNEEAESRKMRNNLIIQGIETGEEDSDQCIKEVVTDFFSQTMKIRHNIAIKAALRLNSQNKENAPIQVTLQNVKDKGVIFKHVKNIKEKCNSKDEGYYINDQLTYKKQEEQHRYKMIKKANRDLTVTDQSTITFKKGKMLINNAPNVKKIIFPDITRTIDHEGKNEKKINDIYLTESETVTNGNCRFVAYSQEVWSLDDIRCGYIKVRRKQTKALHIVCAYSLPGICNAYNQDFCDCGEPGAGRTLLQLLQQNEVTHRAIYVA